VDTHLEDSELLERLRAGDERAYEELVRTHGPPLLALARRLLRNEDDARDVVQETLIAAFRALPGFRGESRLLTWLRRIALNAAMMRRRTRSRRREEDLDGLLPRFDQGGHFERREPGWADPTARLAREELRALVRGAIDELPETYRTVLTLRDLDQLDTAETAALLDVTPNAVKIRLHRARQALRSLLAPRLQEAGP
jgi:RNA polymerase sigma-70 factor (ECF subfamily)